MNNAYNNWKQDYEQEFKDYRDANYRLVYRYQPEYGYYHDSPEWIMVGDFCNFHRRGTLDQPKKIRAKYEKLLLNDINVFEGFCQDEFERISVWHDYKNQFEDAKKIFEYHNFKVRYEDLSTNQRWTFKKALAEHLKEHEEHIELFKKLDLLDN